MNTPTIENAPKSISQILSDGLDIPVTEIAARYRMGHKGILKGLEVLRGTHPVKVAKWEKAIEDKDREQAALMPSRDLIQIATGQKMETSYRSHAPLVAETPAAPACPVETVETPAAPVPRPHTPKDISFIVAPFAALVGMDAAKSIAIDNIHANQKGNVPLLSPVILAPAGTGKTAFSLAWQSAMENTGAETMAILPSQIRRLGKEWDALINFLVRPGRKSLFIDEAHELFTTGRTVQLAKIGSLAMAALDGNRPDWQDVKLSDEISIGFDRRECQIILATNFPGKMPEALAGKSGRSFRLELPLYSDREIAEIAGLMLTAKGIKGNEDSLSSLARVARGSARPLEHLTAALYTRAVLAGKATVNKEDILAAMITCGLFPLGFSREEIRCLEALKTASTLSVIAARFPNLDSVTLKTFMSHALGHSLVGKTNGGFVLTDKGRRYFSECAALKFPVPAL